MYNENYIPRLFAHLPLVVAAISGFSGLTSATPAHALICQDCVAMPTPLPTYFPPKPPMLAFQTEVCLPDFPLGRTQLVEMLTSTVSSSFRELRAELKVRDSYLQEQQRTDRAPLKNTQAWPNTDVRIEECIDQKDANGVAIGRGANIAVWFEQPGFYGSFDTASARDEFTRKLTVRQDMEPFALHVHDGALETFVDIAVDVGQIEADQRTKGTPLENKVNMRSHSVDYNETLKRINTRVDARIDGVLTGEYTNVWATMNDTLAVTSRYVGSSSGPWFDDYIYEPWCQGISRVDHDTSIDTLVANAILAVGDPIIAAFNDGKSIVLNDVIGEVTRQLAGPGCFLAKAFTSRQYLIPGPGVEPGMKVVLDYPRLTVKNGVTFGGRIGQALRNPYVFINSAAGPGILYADPGTQPEGDFHAIPFDMRGPLTYQWQAPEGIVNQPNSATTKIRWNISVQSGQQVSRKVRLTVTDADQHIETREVWVLIRSKDTEPDTGCVMNCTSNDDTM